MSDNDKAKIDDGGSAFPADIQIMRLEAAINQARRFITAAEYAARQLRTGKDEEGEQ